MRIRIFHKSNLPTNYVDITHCRANDDDNEVANVMAMKISTGGSLIVF